MATAPNPDLAQMMARQLIAKLAGGGAGAAGAGAPGAGGPPVGPGGPLPPPPAMLGQGGPGAGGPGGPGGPGSPDSGGGPPTTPPGLQLSQQLAELQNADPDAMVKGVNSAKSICVSLYTRAAFTMPGVTRNLMQAIKYLDNAIQEAEKAAATTAAAGPIANNAAIPNPAGQNGSAPVAGLGSQPGA
jgi:hypothetical protein